jgi:hypothetical protein
MIDVTNIAKAAADAVARVIDRQSDQESAPIRSMVVMSQPRLDGDADSIREWFRTVNDDTAAAAFLHCEQAYLNWLYEMRRLSLSNEPQAAEATAFIKALAGVAREEVRRAPNDTVTEMGQTLSAAGWELTP